MAQTLRWNAVAMNVIIFCVVIMKYIRIVASAALTEIALEMTLFPFYIDFPLSSR
jgi:hypothetical protein